MTRRRGDHPAGSQPRKPPQLKTSLDFEKFVGVRLFAWLGGGGLFVGAAFFLEYSIEHALVPPPLRVGIGLVVGGTLALAR